MGGNKFMRNKIPETVKLLSSDNHILQAIAKSHSIGFIAIDEKYYVQHQSPGVAEVLGIKSNSGENQNLFDLFSFKTTHQKNKLHKALQEKKSVQQIIQHFKDEQLYNIKLNISFDTQHAYALIMLSYDQLEHLQTIETKNTLELVDLTAKISRILSTNQDIDECLKLMGQFSNADRSYIFTIQDNGQYMDNTHEWCKPGVEPEILNLQNERVDDYPFWFETLYKNDIIYYKDVDKIPDEEENLRHVLQMQNIKSIIVVPLNAGNRLIGFMGFDQTIYYREWSNADIKLLRVMSEMISGALVQRKKKKEERRYINMARHSEEIFNMGFWSYDFILGKQIWSDNLCTIYGIKKEEFDGSAEFCRKFVHPEDESKVDKYFQDTLVRKIPVEMEYRIITKQGKIKYLYGKSWVDLKEDQVLQITGVLQDVTLRKKMITELIESEKKYEIYFNTMKMGILIHDRNGQVVDINPAAAEVTGLPREQIIGKYVTDKNWHIITEDGKECPAEEQPSMRVFKTGKPINNTILGFYNPVHKQYKWLKGNAVPIFKDNEKEPYQSFTTFVDISENRQILESLKEREAFLSTIFDAADSIGFITTISGSKSNIAYMSPGAINQFNYNSKNIIFGSDILALIHHKDRQRIKEYLFSILDANTGFSDEIKLVKKDGELFDAIVKIKPRFDHSNNIIGHIFITIDISSIKKVEEQLRQSAHTFQQIFNNAKEGMLLFDNDGNINNLNKAAKETFKINTDELIGKNVLELVDKTEHPNVLKRLNRVKEQGQVEIENLSITIANGKKLQIESIIVPNLMPGLHLAGFIDVTAKNLLFEQLAQSKTESLNLVRHLQSIKEEERAQIAKEIHDEFGQVFSAVKMGLKVLANELIDNDPNFYHKHIDKEIGKTNKILEHGIQKARNLITLLRPPEIDDFGLWQAIKNHINNYAKYSNIQCQLDIDSDNTISGDKAIAIFRIIQESLNNILKHAQATRVEIQIKENSDRLSIQIIDNGIGIEKNVKTEGMGIIGMKERADFFNGELLITKLNNGTRVKLEIDK
jgi:PAS domain S-box-containing protein